MKGDTSSGHEPISTLDSACVLMFAQDSFQIESSNKKLKMVISCEIILDDGGSLWWSEHCLFLVERDTDIFIGNLSSPLSPKQQRNLEQVCAQARVGKIVGAEACVFVSVCTYKSNHQLTFLNIPPCCENSLFPFSLHLPSLSVLVLWHAKSADFIFLPPAVRKCPFQGSQFSPWLSKPYLCLDCFSISNKRQRRDYHFTSFHTLSNGSSLEICKNHCPVAFASLFFPPKYTV